MFKSVTVFTILCILCLGRILGDKILLTVSRPLVVELRNQAEICGKQYGVDPKDLRKILTWTMVHDMPHKKFLHCVFLDTRYVDEAGHLVIENAARFLPVNGTQEEAKKLYEKCNELERENGVETMFAMTTCYHQNFVLKIED